LKQRLIKIELHYPWDADEISAGSASPHPYSLRNSLNKFISSGKYIAVARNNIQLHRKLLRVSREAREVALEFYPIYMPCIMLKAQDLV